MNDMKLANRGEVRARKVLKGHFTSVKLHTRNTSPFDYTAIDKLTGERVAIEVKTTRKSNGKLAHIQTEAMDRKLAFLNKTNRKGIVMVIVVNGETHFYLTKLQQHISKGALIEIAIGG